MLPGYTDLRVSFRLRDLRIGILTTHHKPAILTVYDRTSKHRGVLGI